MECVSTLHGSHFNSDNAADTGIDKGRDDNGKVEIKPISYDIGENAFNYQITTSEENAYIAYYVYNRNEYNYTRDELFNLAKETTEQKIDR